MECKFSSLLCSEKTWLVNCWISLSVSRTAFSRRSSLNAMTSLCLAWISLRSFSTTSAWDAISSWSFSRFLTRPIFLPSIRPTLPPVREYFPLTYLPLFFYYHKPITILKRVFAIRDKDISQKMLSEFSITLFNINNT